MSDRIDANVGGRGGRGRGRGGRARGGGRVHCGPGRSSTALDRAQTARWVATDGWSSPISPAQAMILEDEFADDVLSNDARKYTLTVMQRLDQALLGSNLDSSPLGIIRLLSTDVLDAIRRWTNEKIRISTDLQVPEVEMWEMFQFFGLLSYSHLSGTNFETLLTEMVPDSRKLSKVKKSWISHACDSLIRICSHTRR